MLRIARRAAFAAPTRLMQAARPPRIIAAGLLVAASLAASPSFGADLPGAFRGDAYGTDANAVAGPIAASLGRSANRPCPCEGTDGKVLTNEIDNLSAGTGGGVLTAKAVVSTVQAEKTATSAEVKQTATITGLNLLSGLITADAIKSVADLQATATTMTGSPAGSTLVNLVVAGHKIAANVAPNTVLDLAGIGTLTLNKVQRSGSYKNSGEITVDMLTLDVLMTNSLGLPVGAELVVAHAAAGYNRHQPEAVVAGSAYAAEANAAIGTTLRNEIGRLAFITMGCAGTNGKIRTNNITGASVDSVLALGAGTTTAMSQTSGTTTTAETTANVTGVSLLGGLIQASAITSVAEEMLNGTTLTTSTNGTSFAGLKVGGISIPVDVPPNTQVTLPGVGYVVINEQIQPGAGRGSHLQVNGLRIVATTVNLLGLPVGAEITVAHADVRVRPF